MWNAETRARHNRDRLLNRCRRLAKDWENRIRNALAFLQLASIRLMLRKRCNG
jgi:transposase